ncbi:M20 family metallopeptidase [Arthrobacter sp. MW3 TE3886]|uniref:M20 family metallopeptidase n=1 Tax=Arthrobacter sp. MW3 TE3886 TaxID=3156254 RepID=UPI0035123E33
MNTQTKTDVVALLSELVGIDTTNPGGDEKAGLAVLERMFTDRGIAVEIEEYRAGNFNLTATVSFGDGPTVMLNSHIDVVPAGEGWSQDPFTPTLQNGRVYGRGAADAKGSLAAMTTALLSLLDEADTLSGTVVFTAVGDEEVGSTGARALVTKVNPDACIVGEPTNIRLLSAHKGSIRPVIEVVGRAAHAATPQNGENAITGASELLRMLRGLSDDLAGRDHPLTGGPTLTPVLVSGGQAPNAVPEKCRITLDRRLVPGEENAGALAEVETILADFNTQHAPIHASIVECAPSTGGPSQTDSQHPFVQSCQEAMEDVGENPELAGLVVNCDMTTFRAAGIPTLILGPGTLEVMHAKDEYVEVDQLHRAENAYRAILRRLLVARR